MGHENKDYFAAVTGLQKEIIQKISRAAQQENISIYIVGGFVRDLLLGNLSDDIDLVAESDAINFARAVNRSMSGELKIFEGFKTAKLKTAEGYQIDFATARTEVYETPAALPKVTAGNLKKDLFRRDFTVNALALSLKKENYGGLIDCYNGLEDIKNKNIRVLHEQSFIDDPTRIFRAIRFEQRLGFCIEKHTLSLIQQAVEKKMIEKLDRYRFNNEIALIKSEPKSKQMIKRAESLLGVAL